MSVFNSLDTIPKTHCDIDIASLEPVSMLKDAFSTVPESCRSCSVLEELGRQTLGTVTDYVELYHDSVHSLDTDKESEREDAEERLALFSELVEKFETAGMEVPDKFKTVTPDEFIEAGRNMAGVMLEAQHDMAILAVSAFVAMKDSCGTGPLKMRAAKAGKQYTATICTSDAVAASVDDPNDFPAAIEVKKI